MASKTVTLNLRVDDAEPILREAAFTAAKWSAIIDHVNPRTTYDSPNGDRTEWSVKFLRAKRMVESFGVEYEQTSEAETLTVHFDYVGGKTRKTEMGFTMTTGSKPDYAHPKPAYRREVHTMACHAAADRVVRRWRATLES